MAYRDPVEYLRRTNNGREGFCRTLTTTLLVRAASLRTAPTVC